MRTLKLKKPQTIDITYWWHPFMCHLSGPSNTFFAPMKLSEKRNLYYKINIKEKTIKQYVII